MKLPNSSVLQETIRKQSKLCSDAVTLDRWIYFDLATLTFDLALTWIYSCIFACDAFTANYNEYEIGVHGIRKSAFTFRILSFFPKVRIFILYRDENILFKYLKCHHASTSSVAVAIICSIPLWRIFCTINILYTCVFIIYAVVFEHKAAFVIFCISLELWTK